VNWFYFLNRLGRSIGFLGGCEIAGIGNPFEGNGWPGISG